jgi:uncharacterized protein
MYIDLSQFEEDELHIEYCYDEQFDLQGNEMRLVTPPAIDCWLQRAAHRQYRLKGQVVAAIQVQCDRCLSDFAIPVHAPFDVFYAPIETLRPAEEVWLSPQDLDYGFYRDERIDVDILVREQILLAMPFRLLCKEDCQGLCPRCGVDLNQSSCSCPRDAIDARWTGLLELKRKFQ